MWEPKFRKYCLEHRLAAQDWSCRSCLSFGSVHHHTGSPGSLAPTPNMAWRYPQVAIHNSCCKVLIQQIIKSQSQKIERIQLCTKICKGLDNTGLPVTHSCWWTDINNLFYCLFSSNWQQEIKVGTDKLRRDISISATRTKNVWCQEKH